MQQVLTEKRTNNLHKCVLYGDDDTHAADSCVLDLLRTDDVRERINVPDKIGILPHANTASSPTACALL